MSDGEAIEGLTCGHLRIIKLGGKVESEGRSLLGRRNRVSITIGIQDELTMIPTTKYKRHKSSHVSEAAHYVIIGEGGTSKSKNELS